MTDRKQKLIDLGPDAIADALLELAVHSEQADDLKENKKDNYGIRDTLIDCAGECLPEEVIRTMIATLRKWADKEKDEYGKRHHLMLIESLARQIKETELCEKTRIASWGKLSTAAFIDIARVYLESGDIETSHTWLKKIPEGETFQTYERDKLLEEIYQRQGDTEKLTELLYQKFRSDQTERPHLQLPL